MSRAEGHPREVRVIDPFFFNFYSDFIRGLKKDYPGIPRWNIIDSTFNDGTPWKWIMPETGTMADRSLFAETAFVPFWFIPKHDGFLSNIESVGTALTHTQESRQNPLVRRLIGVCPYAMLRQDSDSHENGVQLVGEAMLATKFNNGIKPYYSDVVLLDPHSNLSLIDMETPHVSLTAIPLFVERFLKTHKTEEERKKVKLVALDKGSLQRCLKFAELAGLDIKTQIIVLDKKRTGHNEIGESTLIYGDPKDADELIIVDDLIDTFKSMGKTAEALKKVGAKKITLMATHGVLSEKAVYRIMSNLDKGTINELVMTDSLPQAAFDFEGNKKVKILKVSPIMARMSRIVAAVSSANEINEGIKNHDPIFQGFEPYIMEPRNKEKVWEEFIQKVGLSFNN